MTGVAKHIERKTIQFIKKKKRAVRGTECSTSQSIQTSQEMLNADNAKH